MPELPEVETVRRGVSPSLEGRVIRRAIARRPDLRWPLPERFAQRLKGRRVAAVTRRSKYLLAALDPLGRSPAETLIVHLGMAGRIAVVKSSETEPETPGGFALPAATAGRTPGPHDHVEIETDAATIVYTDARRFGSMDLWPTERLAEHRLLARLGPEPLSPDFNAAHLNRRLDGKSASIKAALLDQRIVAGLGNIYVCEALFRAGVRPDRAAGSLPLRRVGDLVDAVRSVLTEAIEAGGSTLRDHRLADGSLGYFQTRFAVYGRAEEPCVRPGCGGRVAQIRQTGRSSFYCPTCQR